MEASVLRGLQGQLLLGVGRGQPEWATTAVDLVAVDEALKVGGKRDAGRLGCGVGFVSDVAANPTLHQHGFITMGKAPVPTSGDS